MNSELLSTQTSIKTMHFRIFPEKANEFVVWQGKINTAISSFPGFVSLEIAYPSETSNNCSIVERFDTQQSAEAWEKSEERQELIREIKKLTIPNSFQEQSLREYHLNDIITEVLVTEVDPSKESEFKKWASKIHEVEAKFPGFRGVYLQSPRTKNGRHWITLLKFDTAEHLDTWLNSPERRALLNESQSLLASLETHRIVSPYAGWFTSAVKNGRAPSLLKQSMIILLVLFPIVMLEFKYFNPWVKPLNISLGTFLGNALSVSLLSWPMLPITIKLLDWWLNPPQENYKLYNTLGFLLILGLYALEIAFFWSFI